MICTNHEIEKEYVYLENRQALVTVISNYISSQPTDKHLKYAVYFIVLTMLTFDACC